MSAYDRALDIARRFLPLAEGAAASPEDIRKAVAQVMHIPDFSSLDADALVADLEQRVPTSIGRHITLSSRTALTAWVTPERKAGWRYFGRYRAYLEGQLGGPTVEELDRATDKVLNGLDDPLDNVAFDRRGLVVGDIQSGKTTHLLGMANKAADAGYKLIVILSGTDSDLRAQTQARADAGVIGCRSANIGKGDKVLEGGTLIGVGQIDRGIRPIYMTTLSSDFAGNSDNIGLSPNGLEPIIAVIKKNTKVLAKFRRWLRKQHGIATSDEKSVIDSWPLLVIDDECDNASVDTNQKSDGHDTSDHNPTKVNDGIRKLLKMFSKTGYIGYTGTPYANVLIHADANNDAAGDDLFPRDFIVSLATPDNYLGPARVFGLCGHQDSDDEGDGLADGLPELIRLIGADQKGGSETDWLPINHKQTFVPSEGLPHSLREAILRFVVTSALRADKHNSMLVNVTRLKLVQGRVREQVANAVASIADALRFGDPDVTQEIKALWESDIFPNCRSVAARVPGEQKMLDRVSDWSSIEDGLAAAAAKIKVMAINGDSGDVLQYLQDDPISVIAIGGNKLSRGLTLEGLSVSYFMRNSRTYDALLQMGRWFGYREGYVGLCRLYMDEEVVLQFRNLAEVSEELRREIENMQGMSPREAGIRIRSHPSLMATSRNKMRDATMVDVSYSGRLSETKLFYASDEERERNRDAVEKFFTALGYPDRDPMSPQVTCHGGKRKEWSKAYLWHDVSVEHVLDFLGDYTMHEDADLVRTEKISAYIQERRKQDPGLMDKWNVTFLTSKARLPQKQIAGLPYTPRLRSPDPNLTKKSLSDGTRHADAAGKYVIKRLLTEADELIDISEATFDEAKAAQKQRWSVNMEGPEPAAPTIETVREYRKGGNGLVMIYPIVPARDGEKVDWQDSLTPYFGVAFVFPGAKEGSQGFWVSKASTLGHTTINPQDEDE